MSTDSEADAVDLNRDDIMRQFAELRQRITTLEETVESKNERIDELQQELREQNQRSARERAQIRQRITSVEEDVDTVEDVPEDLRDERDTRGREDAKLRRRIAAVAEKAGVDVTDADLLGDDKIQRVVTHGVDDVESSPTTTHYRAATLLERLPEWGTKMADKKGRRVAITAPEVRSRMEDARDEKLQTSQVNRVFKQIVTWAADSPRYASFDTSRETNRLVLSLEEVNKA
jgi:chromosome segregation ATPase